MKVSTLDPPTSERRGAARTTPPEAAPAPMRRAPWAMRLRRHLSIALVAKLLLLAILYFLFFSPSQRPHIDAQRAADHLLTPG